MLFTSVVLVMLVVSGLSFCVFNFLGDPVNNILGVNATLEQREELRVALGLDQPTIVQFWRFVERAAVGDFGVSYKSRRLIAEADVVAPVPLHRFRLLSRRFNQAAEIARPLARASALDYAPDALIRISHTASQGGRSRRGRRLNVKAAFAVTEAGRRRIKGRRVLLIDDVLTTGATAEACARALTAAGARAVDLAVVARVRNAREIVM